MALGNKQRVFIEEYLQCWNATEAAKRAGYSPKTAYSIGHDNLRKPEIAAHIRARIEEKAMSADEVLLSLAEHARSNIGEFYKVVEEWTFFPLPTYDILDAVEVEDTSDPDNPVRRVNYFVRHVAVDTDKIVNSDYSRLIQKISDSPRSGLELELYNQQTALVHLGKHLGLFQDRLELTDRRGGAGGDTFDLPADCMARSFLDVYRDIKNARHLEYVLYGGRGSTKSSFVSLVIIYLMVNHPAVHGMAVRQVAETLRESVYNQLIWAIGELGLSDQFKMTVSPMEITYLPTGQKMYFRGADDPGKIKSIKPPFGYIGLLWLEELDQFHGEEAVRKIEQSVIRGGDLAFIFKSFNPPRTANSWVNRYVKIPKPTQYQHKSSYLDVPVEWLGKPWLDEAEHLKTVNPGAYEHEYLGEVNGTGGLVFENVELRAITPDEIAQFDQVLHGLDWGFFPDPAAYNRMHYDAARLTLYIFAEYRVLKQPNRLLWDALVERGLQPNDLLIADSAEPKSIADFKEYGASIRGAEKGPDSVNYSIKWLQSLRAIVIDPARCPETMQEFIEYELEQDKDGDFISKYPDRDNHHIDAVRYATNLIWRRRGK